MLITTFTTSTIQSRPSLVSKRYLGTPQKLIDSGGTVVWSAKYTAFGEVVVDVSAVTNNLRFPGQYYDEETGLLYNYQRYYDPRVGRYLRVDPIGFDGRDVNWYAYVWNNPTQVIDNMGLSSQPEPCSKGFCVVGTEIKRRVIGKIFASLGIDHVDITFNNQVIYVGMGGGMDRMNQTYRKTNNYWELTKKHTDQFRWGNKAGKACSFKEENDIKNRECQEENEMIGQLYDYLFFIIDLIAEKPPYNKDILDCLRSKPRTQGKNCQGDVQEAVDGCCLSGFSTLVSQHLGTWFAAD